MLSHPTFLIKDSLPQLLECLSYREQLLPKRRPFLGSHMHLVILTQLRTEFTVKSWSRISLGLNLNLNIPSVQSCFLPFLFTDVDPKSTQLTSYKLNSISGFPWKPICNNSQEPHCRSVDHTRIKIPIIVSTYTFL